MKQLAKVLTEQGHSVEVASLDDPAEPWVADFPLPIHALGPGQTSLGYTPRLVPWLQENVLRFDAVVVNGLWMYNSLGTWRALKGSKIPYFVFTHGMLDPWFNKAYPLKWLKKLLYWFWGQYPVLRDARAVLFTSEEEMLLARISFRPYKVNEKVVKYGTPGPNSNLETLRKQFLEKYPQLAKKHVLIYLSRIHPKKGCDLLIKAFSDACKGRDDLMLVMAGPDKTNWVPELMALAERCRVADKILWPGMLSGDDKWGAYAASNAFVLPSHQENFGIVVAEALSCGIPTLISDKVNIWREIVASGAGIVARDTQEGTNQLITQWLAMSPDAQATMGLNAMNCFMTNFEIHAAAASLLEITRDGRQIQ